ncbi:MAG: hypothetical protein VXX11_03240 [Planctomycetota bacterium]|nr:hypothetical protein [Planctomycetota bacterium]|tara:strand:- start:2935 stop:3330 length:396 start_codon:yes stop_codon:yes gene_type:complete
MSNDIKQGVDDITAALAPKAVEEIGKALGKVEVKEEWQSTLIGVVADSIDTYGVTGIEKAKDLVWNLVEGKPFDQEAFDNLSLRAQSDLLAQLQNKEADEQTAVKDFFAVVGDVLGGVLVAVAKGLIAKSI